MTVLLFLVVFILAIDQYAFTGILHRPFIACTLLGLVMGDVNKGVILGGALEIILAAYKQANDGMFIDNTDFLLFSIVSSVFVLKSGMDTASAISSAIAVTTLGAYIQYALADVNTFFLPLARKAAEKKNEKSLGISTFAPLLIAGCVYGALGVAAYNAGEVAAEQMDAIMSTSGWVFNGLAYAGMMMPAIGLAVLLRNIQQKQVPGALFAGLAAGVVLVGSSLGVSSLLVGSAIAFAIGAFVYTNEKKKEPEVKTNVYVPEETTGGNEKWW